MAFGKLSFYIDSLLDNSIPRYRFHQNPDLLYLTGYQEPDAVLIMESNLSTPLPDHKSVLYVRPRDPRRSVSCMLKDPGTQ